MLYSNTRTTPRSEHNWLVSAATDVWFIPPPSFPPTHVNPRCDDVTNLTFDGVKRFTPAVRHIHVTKWKRSKLKWEDAAIERKEVNRKESPLFSFLQHADFFMLESFLPCARPYWICYWCTKRILLQYTGQNLSFECRLFPPSSVPSVTVTSYQLVTNINECRSTMSE